MSERMRWLRWILCGVLLVFSAGCETSDNPDTDGVETHFEDDPAEPSSHGSLPDPTYTLTVTASATTLSADGDRAVLTVNGGVAPYNWTVQDINLGNISTDAGASVVYTRLNAGANAVTVNDSQGHVGNLVLQQP
ncbi:MAG: hypothetical protein PHP44_06940 [Kiritimatiellae bacterium]|nr:hypothetical protein [Kiritimatiellia bacterium]